MSKCAYCQKVGNPAEMLESGEEQKFYCTKCFKAEYYHEICKSPSTLTRIKSKNTGDAVPPTRPMFSQEDLEAIHKAHDASHLYNFSKRPIICPHVDCNRCIRLNDLIEHFRFEHPPIPILTTSFDRRNSIHLKAKEVRYGSKQCLALFKLTQNNSRARGYPIVLVLMVTRLAVSDLVYPGEKVDDLSTKGVYSTSNDRIIVWVASNIANLYSATIAVSATNDSVRIKYYGPILQLSFTPQELCKSGKGLILRHFQFEGLTEDAEKLLQVDVLIHDE